MSRNVFPFGAIEQESFCNFNLSSDNHSAVVASKAQSELSLIEVPSQRTLKDDTHTSHYNILIMRRDMAAASGV
jgi:hypothetical protein